MAVARPRGENEEAGEGEARVVADGEEEAVPVGVLLSPARLGDGTGEAEEVREGDSEAVGDALLLPLLAGGGCMCGGSRQLTMTPSPASLLIQPGMRLPQRCVASASAKLVQLRERMWYSLPSQVLRSASTAQLGSAVVHLQRLCALPAPLGQGRRRGLVAG